MYLSSNHFPWLLDGIEAFSFIIHSSIFLETLVWDRRVSIGSFGAGSWQAVEGSFENEALKNDQSTKHPNLENEAPKTQKRSTQILKPL